MESRGEENSDLLVLVDWSGREIGEGRKLHVHSGEGSLHLAFSILVANAAGDLLLQRRASRKYHFAGLWSNTCCGHPRPGEPVRKGGMRRLHEEFGIEVELRALGTFLYRAHDEVSGLTEHEYVHVLHGRCEEEPQPDPREISAWEWRTPARVRNDVARDPTAYTPWFPRVLEAFEHAR